MVDGLLNYETVKTHARTEYERARYATVLDQWVEGSVQNQKARSDPGSLPTRSDVEKLDSSGNMVIPLSATAVPFWLPPGLSLIYLNEYRYIEQKDE